MRREACWRSVGYGGQITPGSHAQRARGATGLFGNIVATAKAHDRAPLTRLVLPISRRQSATFFAAINRTSRSSGKDAPGSLREENPAGNLSGLSRPTNL